MITRVNATVLFVQDLEAAIRFYRDLLGIEVVFSDATSYALRMEGQDFALVTLPSGVDMLNADLLGIGAGVARRVMLCTDVNDVDAAYDTLSAKGVPFLKPPQDQYWGWRTAYFTDPDGNIWELRQAIPALQ